jgi:hypothetical protein
VVGIVCFLPSPAPCITIGGRVGIEVDGLGEEYEAYGLFDDRVGDGSIEEELDQAPVRSREAAALALLDLRLDAGKRNRSWFQLSESARWGIERARSSLRAQAELHRGADRLRFENQWDLQDGDEEPVAGSQDALHLIWDRDSLPAGLRTQVRVGAEWSEAAKDSLAALLDTRTLRGHVQVRRPLTSLLDMRALAGVRSKTALRSKTGSYDMGIAELEAQGSLRANDQLEALGRFERRSYRADSSAVPSSDTWSFDGRYSFHLTRAWQPYVDLRLERQDYDSTTSVFQDHRLATAELGTSLSLSRLREEGADLDPFRAEWKLRVGGRAERQRSEAPAGDSLAVATTYDSFGGLLGFAREGVEGFWFDVAFEVGRRDYQGAGGSSNLVFEGLNFSLSSSDYTYFRTTLLTQWSPVRWLRMETFLEWDEERHERSADDFRLWIVNASLTVPF